MKTLQQRESSTVIRAEENGRTVYRKRYLEFGWQVTGDVIRRRVEREDRLIRQLHDAQAFGERLGLVRILSAAPETASLVMEEVQGEPLQESIAHYSKSRGKEILPALFLAGRWLQVFQRVELSSNDRIPIVNDVDPHDLAEYCAVRLKRLGELGYAIDTRLSRGLLRRVKTLVEDSKEEDRRFVWAHGDYAPGNLIWDGRMLTPIDFGMVQANRPLLDVTYLIHRLEMLQIYRPWKSWPISLWKEAFLRGYGRPDAEKSSMYQALMIRHFLCRLLTYVWRPPRDLKQRLHNGWVRRVVGRRLNSLMPL